MDEAIELPPEANPLTPQILFNILQSAASPYQQQVRSATQQLQTWETEKGYYSLLQDVFADKSLPLEIRYLSIIQLKNGIDKYWRKTAQNAVSKDEKALIRSKLLEAGMNEADRRLAVQNALVIAKIVRFEYPHDWPDVISSTLSHLRQSTEIGANPIHLSRALLILLYIVKELSTARLQRSRSSLLSVTPEIIFVLGRLYVEKTRRWQSFLVHGGDDEGGALDDIDLSLLTIKIMRRLFVAGYDFPNRDKEVREFWSMSRSHFQDLLVISQIGTSLSKEVHSSIEKHLVQLAKLHLEMIRAHPAAFVLLPDSVDLIRAYWGLVIKLSETFGSKSTSTAGHSQDDNVGEGEIATFDEKLALKALMMLRASVRMVFQPVQTFKYRQPEDKQEQKESVELLKSQLLTEAVIREIMETIVTRFFVFRELDLREWEEEPEEWERRAEGEGDAWEFSIRPCSEKLFLDMVLNFRDLLVEPLLAVFRTVSTLENENILFKDSVYTAVGLSAAVLRQSLDFDAFLNTTLVEEIKKTGPGFNILRRRVAILIGQWIPVKVSVSHRYLVYEIFQHLLDKEDSTNDLVVRITAGRHFKHVVDEWEFDSTAFLPYAPRTLTRLMGLIEEVGMTETKLALINTVSMIVERLQHEIAPYSERIVALLPPLWEQSGEEHLSKQAILTILTRLISSMKAQSQRYHSFSIPLIMKAVDPASEMQVYLLEEALELWATILVQTPSPPSSDILSLAPYLFPVFELGTENLRKALDITKSYILLAPREMLQDEMRSRLFGSFSTLLGTVKAEACGIITHLIEVIIRVAEGLGGEQALEIVGKGLVESDILIKVMEGLRGSWEAHQTTGPNKKYPAIDGVVETDYFNLLARLALASPGIFVMVLQAVCLARNEQLSEMIEWLLTEWFSQFGNISYPDKRKLNCLALTRLLQTSQPWILTRLQDLMTVWTDVVSELQEGAEERGGDLLYWDGDGHKHDAPEAPEEERQRQLTFSDPIHTVNTAEFIRQHLQEVMIKSGGQEAFQREWLANVDGDIIGSFGKLGIM